MSRWREALSEEGHTAHLYRREDDGKWFAISRHFPPADTGPWCVFVAKSDQHRFVKLKTQYRTVTLLNDHWASGHIRREAEAALKSKAAQWRHKTGRKRKRRAK